MRHGKRMETCVQTKRAGKVIDLTGPIFEELDRVGRRKQVTGLPESRPAISAD